MGNTKSSEETEEQSLQRTAPVSNDSSAVAGENLLDFSSLFQPEELYRALLAVKEPPGSAVSRSKDGMVRWLNGLVDKDEHSVNMVQVVEHLTGKGVPKEEALEFFSEVDRDGEGQVDIAYLLMVLKQRAVDPMQALIPCHSLPGPVEVYLPKNCSQTTGRKLVQFLTGRRVEPACLVVACMSQILNHQLTREKLVQGRYQMFLAREDDHSLLAEGGGDTGSDIQQKVVVTKCYSAIEASSSPHQIKNMTDNRTDTCWQSSGSPRSHWIRLRMLPGMTVRELAVTVDTRDDSYMPRTIVVSVGNSENSLSDVKTVHIPRDKTGLVVLVRSLGRVYQYVQINIKACHSDGCDVKIRGLYVKGTKVQEHKKPGVLDTMVIWYISLLASTAKAAIPSAPQLREVIINHSRSALKAFKPLVLSPTSASRPEFLSSFVVHEMENMLKSLSIPDDSCEAVPMESLEILLAFSIAHGNVNSILDCLYILLEYQHVYLNVLNLLQQMEDTKRTKYLNHAEVVQLSVTSCSGGFKDENHKPDNLVSNDMANSSATPYVSSSGHKTVTVVLREKDGKAFSPTRLVVQVPSASNAATSCLFFLLEQEPDQPQLEALKAYENWGREDYNKWKEEEERRDENGLIALTEFSKDRRQVDTTPDVSKKGQALVVVMSANGEEVEDVAVQVLSVFGHCNTADKQPTTLLDGLDTNAPLPLEMDVVGGVVLCRVLVFLSVLLQDLSGLMDRRRLVSLEPSLVTEPHLSVEELSLEKIWRIYTPLSSKSGGQTDYPALLALWLLRSALPFIKPEKTGNQSSSTGISGDSVLSSAILGHLCALLDAEEETVGQSAVQDLVQEIVVKGVVVFFPDATARKEYLLTMIESVLSEKQPRSWWLKFEALCKYFSKSDANSLLGLPSQLKKDEAVETGRALELLTTMLTVATRESLLGLSSGKSRPNDLVSLLCALQASLFFWCRTNIPATSAQKLLLAYVEKLVTMSTRILKEITAVVKEKEEMKVLQQSVLTRTLAEMLVFLPTVAKPPIDRPRLMNTLYPLVPALQAATSSCAGVFLRLADTRSLEEQKESVVGVWTRESSHNYENNARISEEFVCPSATKFVVEFDSRCVTERRYDYLEFTDITGAKHKFDGKFNSDRWPRTAEFPGQKLQFVFHSDGSNNDWGYMFTLKAYGEPAPSLHWLLDLQLSVARVLGQLTSVTLSMKTLYTQLPEQQTEEQKEELLLTRSDLWRTLFRGGYMAGKLIRSLSGAHMANPADSQLNTMLQSMATGSESETKQLLDSLRERGKGPYYGGELVDQAVNAVFAALIWHCQDLREELTTHPDTPSQLLQDAFSTAEGLRRELVEMRQKLLEAKGKEDGEEKSEVNEDSPLINCRDKAIFLLKFAGLSRVVRDREKEEEEEVGDGHKVSNAVNTVSRLKQQLSLGGQAKPRKKPVSFELVLSFVKNEAATMDKVQRLLQEREKLASWAAQAYTFAANYLSAITIDNMFELPGLVFLQQLISSQRHFPIHYAAKLDGCGLELENQVRKGYHLLLKQLLEGLAIFSQPPTKEYSRARVLVGIVTCHLLDFQWQGYDNHLLSDLQLSDFLLQSAIKSTQSEEKQRVEKFENEEAMLERYTIHMALLEKCKEEMGGESRKALEELDLYSDNKWEGDLFITAKSSPTDTEVAVQCDSCQALIRDGLYYHNMDLKSTSFDLCPRCFKSGSGSRPADHAPDQLYLAMGRFYCHNCKLCIMSHRFHSSSRVNVDLCLGCLREEEGKSTSDNNWTVYLLTEVPASGSANRYMTSEPGPSKPLLYQDGCITSVEPALDLMVYQQHHCWLLFTALCLGMADYLNTRHSTSQQYRSQACHNLLQCLRQLASILHTAVLGRWEEQASKTRADEAEKQSEEEEKEIGSSKMKEEGGPDKTADKAADKAGGRDKAAGDPDKTGGRDEAVGDPDKTGGRDKAAEDPDKAGGRDEARRAAVNGKEEDQHQTTVAMETETVDLIAEVSRVRCQQETAVPAVEKTFASLNITRTLYTLAAVLPQDMSLSPWFEGEREKDEEDVERTITTELLPALLEVATCPALQQLSCNLAHIVIAQYMARVSPQVADRSMEIACDLSPAESATGGSLTIKFYFSLGARFLHKSDFSGAATIAECLLILSKSEPWTESVSQSILSHLTTRAEEMDLTSIFGLLVLAGFPKLHRDGSLVKVHSKESERQQGQLSVLTSVLGESGTVASCEHREPQSVRLSCCEVEDTLQGCITSSQLASLLPLLRRSIQLAKQESDRQIETTWVLALTLKALLALLKGPGSKEVVEAVLKEKLLPEVGRLACKATRLTQKWLASDLEVVAIRGYQPVGRSGSEQTESGEKKEEVAVSGSEEKQKKDEKDEKQASLKAEEVCLEGLSDEIQDMLVIMQEAFQCPLSTLRALFDASGADVNQFILSSEQYYDMESATLKPPDDILEAATKWESDMTSEVRDIQDSLEDTGVTRLVPIPFSPTSLEAEAERPDILKRPKSLQLMQEDSRPEEKEHKQDTSREDSFQLLQEQQKEGVASRKQLLRIHQAVVVLYSRHVLAALLSHWPSPPHPLFSTSLLGTMDTMQLFCLLDLLVKPLDQQASSDLLRALVLITERTQLVTLAVTASECMRKVSVGVEKKQFRHPTQGAASEEKGKVMIANASSMSVVFHQTRGEVEVASKEDFCEHHKIASSSETNSKKEITHIIPGNTVYYRVKQEAVKQAKPPCCTLTVTGIQMGRFSTGLRFMEQLLSEAGAAEGEALLSSLPLAQLWPNLIAVACHHTGNERLKVVCLLLQLLVIMRKSRSEQRPNLSSLKPLWQFYTTLVKDYEAKNKSQQVIAPQILRALTELFLAVENQAEEWGVSQTMVIETLTKEGLGTWLEKGISNVAYLSLGLGLVNAASRAFAEAKRTYVPPVEDNEREEEEEEKDGGEGDSSSEDTSHPASESDNSFYSDES